MRSPPWAVLLNGSIIERIRPLACALSWGISARGRRQHPFSSPVSSLHDVRTGRTFLCPSTSICEIWTSTGYPISVCAPYWNRCSVRAHRPQSMWIAHLKSSPPRGALSYSTAWMRFSSTWKRAQDRDSRADCFKPSPSLLLKTTPTSDSCSLAGASISVPSEKNSPSSRDRIGSASAARTIWSSPCCPSMRIRSWSTWSAMSRDPTLTAYSIPSAPSTTCAPSPSSPSFSP